MNCGCTKDLGCFAYNENIDFGFVNACPGDADFTFQIWNNGSFLESVVTFGTGEQIVLPYTFNENADVMIKIKLPSCYVMPGVNYATSSDGACCFIAHGIVSTCI